MPRPSDENPATDGSLVGCVRSLGTVAILFLASPAAADGCREPVGKDFASAPVTDIRLAPEPLLRLNERLDGGTYDIRALLILRDCRLVFERYKDGVTRDHNHAVYSVTKSVVATLVGGLLHQRRLGSVDTPVAVLMTRPLSIPPERWQKTDRITLRNVMQMSTGLDYRHDPVSHPIYANRIDRFSLALTPGLVAEPGTRFNYSDGDASITGAAVAALADNNLYRFAREALFDPLQMSNHDWPYTDAAGRPPGGWALRLRPMDMLKVGQLYVQDGTWNGERLFGPHFTQLAWAPGPASFYALHWWIGQAPQARGIPYFFASGFKGQRIFVLPTLRLVAVLSASLPGPEITTVHTSVIGALVAAATSTTLVEKDHLEALRRIQTSGFSGETRVAQSAQDRPQR